MMKNWAKKIGVLGLLGIGILTADSVNAQSRYYPQIRHRAPYYGGNYHMNPYQRKMMQAMQAQAQGSRYMGYMFQQDAAYMDAVRNKHIYMEHARQNQARAMQMYKNAQAMLEKNQQWGFTPFTYNRFTPTHPVLQFGSKN